VSWWQQLKEAAGALAAYWLMSLFALVAFCAVVLWFNNSGEDALILTIIAGTSVAGLFVGQLTGFARIRPWIVWTGVAILIAVGIAVLSAGASAPGMEYVAFFLIFFPLAFNSGIWTLRARMHLLAVWYPLMLAVGAVIIVAEETGGAEAWFAGRKWAIWSIPSFTILAGIILLTLVYLVAQESYSLARWRAEGSAPDRRETRESGKPRVRLSLAGWVVILLLSAGLTVVTAVVAPYLWRSAPAEDGHPTDGGGEGDGTADGGGGSGQGGGGGSGGGGGGSGGGGGGSGGGGGGGSSSGGGGGSSGGGGGSGQFDGEGVGQQLQQALSALLYLILLLSFMALLAVAAAILHRPMRRAFLLHHFQDPLWPVPPSAQIVNLWRRTEVSLRDAGFEPSSWESAPTVARRARGALAPSLGMAGNDLQAAAEIYRRAAYGLGVGDEDVARMRAAAACVADALTGKLSFGERFRGQFRRI